MRLVNIMREIKEINQEGVLPKISISKLEVNECYNVVIDAALFEDSNNTVLCEHLVASIIEIKNLNEALRDFGNILNGLNTKNLSSFNRIKASDIHQHIKYEQQKELVENDISDTYKIKINIKENIGMNIELLKLDEEKRVLIKFGKFIPLSNERKLGLNILALIQNEFESDTITTFQYNNGTIIEETVYIGMIENIVCDTEDCKCNSCE